MDGMVSIIIPVYNEKELFKECIDSILMQSYSNFELIVVDDGSEKDNSAYYDDICKNDPRIKLFHIENKGVSYARNFGILKSNGKWIMFVDSDDCLIEGAIEFLINSIQDNNLAAGNYCRCGIATQGTKNVSRCYNANEIMRVAIEYEKYIGRYDFLPEQNKAYFLSVWAKLYSGEVIRNNLLRFNENIKYCEDLLFNLDYLSCIHDVVISNRVVYLYKNNPRSASHKNGIRIINESEKIIDEFLRSGYENIQHFCVHYLALTFIDIVKLNDSDLYKEYIRIIRKDDVSKAIKNYNPNYLNGVLGNVIKIVSFCWRRGMYKLSYYMVKKYINIKSIVKAEDSL